MGPWSKPTNARTQAAAPAPTLGPAEWALIIGLAALVILSAAALWLSRYEIGGSSAFPFPTRLDRVTGQVIGCVPGQGCVELVPAGEPKLRSAVIHRGPGASGAPEAGGAAPAGNAAATPPAAGNAPAAHAKP
jgi:hypothetical protein